MSSDTFRYRVEEVEGRDVVITIRPTTAGGLGDLCSTRSFVAILLREQGGPLTFEQTTDAGWLAQHLDEVVTRVVPVRLEGTTSEYLIRKLGAEWAIPAEILQPRLTLRATMATEALAACFSAGTSDGTTAYDVWWDDPKREDLPEAEPLGVYAPEEDLAARLEQALAERLPGWTHEPGDGLRREGPDAALTVRLSNGYSKQLRSTVEVSLHLSVPTLSTLPAPPKRGASGPKPTLLWGVLHDEGVQPQCWFRRFASDPATERLELWEDDAPLETFEAMADRLARALSPEDLDRLLTREGLLGLVEQGAGARPVKKGRPAPSPIGEHTAPRLPAGWRWTWGGYAGTNDIVWGRLAIHACFGDTDDTREALRQAQELSKKVPADLKPLIASLQAPSSP